MKSSTTGQRIRFVDPHTTTAVASMRDGGATCENPPEEDDVRYEWERRHGGTAAAADAGPNEDKKHEDEAPIEIEDFSCKTSFEKVVSAVENALKQRQQVGVAAGKEEGGGGITGLQVTDSDRGPVWSLKIPHSWFEVSATWDRCTSNAAFPCASGSSGGTEPNDLVPLCNPLRGAVGPNAGGGRGEEGVDTESAWALQVSDLSDSGPAEGSPHVGVALIQSLRWNFPLLSSCMLPPSSPALGVPCTPPSRCAVMIVRPYEFHLRSIRNGSLYRIEMPDRSTCPFEPELALSAAVCAAEGVRAEAYKQQQARPPPLVQSEDICNTKSDGTHPSASSVVHHQEDTKSGGGNPLAGGNIMPPHQQLPTSFVPVTMCIKELSNGHLSSKDGMRRGIIWQGSGISSFAPPQLLDLQQSGAPQTSVRLRCCAEWAVECPAQCRLLGDAVDLFHQVVGLKSRVHPLLLHGRTYSERAEHAAEERRAALLATTTTTTWVCVEHLYA